MKNEYDPLSPPEEFPAPPPELPDPPEEFPAPAPEIPSPPEEFSAQAQRDDSSPKRRRKLLYALAAGALLLLLLPRLRPALRPLSPDAAPSAAPVSSPEPSPESEPTPEPEPSCEILYYAFSSAHYVRLQFILPDAFTSVELELWEPILDLPAGRYTLTREEIAAGELELSLGDGGDLYWEHHEEYDARDTFPEWLELRATLTYEGKDGLVTERRTLQPSPEQGWAIRYWAKDEEATEWSFPGYFRFQTYESYDPVALVLDDPDAVRAGTISVSFSIDGRAIDPAQVQYDTWQEAHTIAGMEVSEPFYYARFLFPKPAWAPEQGVLHVTVTQYLEGYDQTVVIERDYPYSEGSET